MLPFQLKDINEQVIQQLCDEHCPESDSLDFKREPAGRSDDIQKDICAMANTNGGDILIGVDEDGEGRAGSLMPIPGSSDALELKYRQILDAIEPRIHGIQMQSVPVADGFVLVIRVPTSFEGPHTFRPSGGIARRFAMRNGTTTSDMTMQQIRSAFTQTGTLIEKAKQFLSARDEKIAANNIGRRLVPGPEMAVHFIPLSGLAGSHSVDVRKYYSREFPRLAMGHGNRPSLDRALNLDGLQVFSPSHEGMSYGVTQLFRNGTMEVVVPAGYADAVQRDIYATGVAISLREIILGALQLAKDNGASGPAILRLAIFNTTGFRLGVGRFSSRPNAVSDRAHLILPDQWIDDIQTLSDIDSIARPLLDLFWQCFDMECCLDYTEEGIWQPR